MSYYSGQHGRFYIGTSSAQGTTAAAAVRNWSFSTTMSPLTTTSLADTDQTYINGLRTTSGSCTLLYYDYGSNSNDCATLIRKLVKARTSSTTDGPGVGDEAENCILRLNVDTGSANGDEISFECLLTNVAMNMAVGEVFSARVDFQVTGALRGVSL